MIHIPTRTFRDLRQATAVLIAATVTGACTGGEAREAPDTAADRPTWSLHAPLSRVGGGDGAGEALDRVYGGFLRPDGSVVVGNAGTAELRTYAADGRFVAAAGRRGAGPGEFGSINWIGVLPGDSLIAFDMRHQRFSVWSPAGAFVRVVTSQVPPGPIRPIGVFGDGSVLLVREAGYDPRAGAGVVRDSLRTLRMLPTGAVTPIPGAFPGAEWLIYEHPASFRATQLPFGRTGHLAVVDDHFVYGSSETGTLAVHDASGRQIRTIRLDAPARDPSREEISVFLKGIQDAGERRALERVYGGGGSASAAVFTALRGDDEGNLWVRTAPRAGADSVTWIVLSPGGERRGSVRMHTGWLPLDIRRGTLLLRETDADGVQTVSVRRVAR